MADSPQPENPVPQLALVLVRLFVVLMFVVHAWVGDDAFITLRTVDHFVEGRGLVWNLGERVQVFTHPLWMFVLAGGYLFTHEPFYRPHGGVLPSYQESGRGMDRVD